MPLKPSRALRAFPSASSIAARLRLPVPGQLGRRRGEQQVVDALGLTRLGRRGLSWCRPYGRNDRAPRVGLTQSALSGPAAACPRVYRPSWLPGSSSQRLSRPLCDFVVDLGLSL